MRLVLLVLAISTPVLFLHVRPLAAQEPHAPATPAKAFGVNIAGAEFTEGELPGSLGTHYVYPVDAARQDYFASKGLQLVRVPFRWERVQHEPFAALHRDDVDGLRRILDAVYGAGQRAILDLHNYGRYHGVPLGRDDAPGFADVWLQLAMEFGEHPGLFGYELMNEPHNLPGGSETWGYLAQGAINHIRLYDSQHWILVPGYSWQSARFWPEHNQGLDVSDPAGALLYSAHQYFDGDETGRYSRSYDADGTYPSTGVDRLRPFLEWLETRDALGIVTEYGVPGDDPRWLDVLDSFLAALQAHPRIVGGTYWAAGPWWGDYPLSIEPRGAMDRPQMAVIERYTGAASRRP